MNRLEVHHVFPKAQLYKRSHSRPEVNALANFCFLTKNTNLAISDRVPEDYFPEIEAKQPGALTSQWIPADPVLWKIENYLDFLEARKMLLAAEANRRIQELLHGDTRWMGTVAPVPAQEPLLSGAVTSEAEEVELETFNNWVAAQGLPRGELAFEYSDPTTGQAKAVFDLAWPDGLQPGLTQPIAVLVNANGDILALANAAGYRCFTTLAGLRGHIANEVLRLEAA